jgi:hypothetical protein
MRNHSFFYLRKLIDKLKHSLDESWKIILKSKKCEDPK